MAAALVWIFLQCGQPIYVVGVSKDAHLSYPTELIHTHPKVQQALNAMLEDSNSKIYTVEITEVTREVCL